MFHELVDDPGERTLGEIHDRYRVALAAAVEERGIDEAEAETGIEREKLLALSDGELPELTLEEGAAILALSEDAPDAETIAVIARDELLMGMTTAVLDVEAVESGIEGELEAREIQSKIEGRYPMTLREFALLHGYIAGAK